MATLTVQCFPPSSFVQPPEVESGVSAASFGSWAAGFERKVDPPKMFLPLGASDASGVEGDGTLGLPVVT